MNTSPDRASPSCCSPRSSEPAITSSREALSVLWSRADKAVLTIVLIVLGIAWRLPEQLRASIAFTVSSLLDIAPWIAISVLIAAYAKASKADALIARAFTGHPARMIALASLFGALSPFCSCGVVPVIAGLLGAGVPLPPVMAFWMSSPLMDPNMFFLTVANLGLEFAVVKTLVAVGMGLLSGAITYLLVARGFLSQALRIERSDSPKQDASAHVQWNVLRSPQARHALLVAAVSNGWMLLRWMTLAFLLESLMVSYLPADKVAALLGQNASAIPFAVLIGIPAYLNGFAALPLVRGLIDLGMSPAVALAFLVSGGVTSIPAATAVWALVKPRLFAVYLFLAVFGSLLAAFAYSAWLALP